MVLFCLHCCLLIMFQLVWDAYVEFTNRIGGKLWNWSYVKLFNACPIKSLLLMSDKWLLCSIFDFHFYSYIFFEIWSDRNQIQYGTLCQFCSPTFEKFNKFLSNFNMLLLKCYKMEVKVLLVV